MKHTIFLRIFVLYGLILLAAVAVTEVTVTSVVRDAHLSSLKDNLLGEASLIGRDVSFQDRAPLDDLCRQFKEATHARVTVIARNGNVLGDSDHASATMDNHRDRLEIEQADLNGSGLAIRHSETLNADHLYVAINVIRAGKPAGFVRLSVPLTDVDASINRLRIKIILTVSAILISAGMFSVWQIVSLRKFTIQIRDFSLAVARGDIEKRLILGHAGEFEQIAESLNTMSVELKQSMSATEEERNRLSVILSNIPDALLISDEQGVILIANAASRIFFGEAVLQGKQFVEVVRDRGFLQLLDKVRNERFSDAVEITLDHPEQRYCVVRIAPLSYRDRDVSGFIALFHDITRLRRLEQVRQDFIANISHEIKTPITAIQGFADTLLNGAMEDHENAGRFLKTIRDNSQRINSLVDDLMTISKIELGVIRVGKADIEFRDAADRVLALLSEKAAAKGLSLTFSCPPELGMIQADSDRLVQILTNLIDNAIKFTNTGGVTFGLAEENGNTVMFVRDTGIGIPEKHLSRIGERFYRVDASRSRKMGGTGLGLAIVKHLVKAHNWDMKIESRIGNGTIVRIFV